MLDKLRQQSRSFIIWFLFGVIILSFVVTFGPASMRLSCGGASKAGTVAGREISNADLQFALRLGMVRNAPATYRATVYDQLVRRELLAMEAERMGFKVAEKEIVQMITKRRQIYVLGVALDLAMLGAWPQQRNKEGKLIPAQHYYHDRFKRWVQYQLGMKVPEFMEQQKKELMALRVEETIKSGVIVSEREARAVFEYQTHAVELEFARFKIDDFRKGILVDRAKVLQWLSEKANRDKVDARYKKTKWKLTGLPKERRVRHILVKADPKAPEAQKKAAEDKLRKLRLSLMTVPTDFAKMAQLLSEDQDTKESGGDLGWREQSKLGFGKDFAEAVFKLKPMTVSAILKSDKGYHLALVEAERQGDVPLEKARVWLAEEMLGQQMARASAKGVAKKALRRLLAGQSMAEVFPPAETPGEDADTKDGESSGDKPPGSEPTEGNAPPKEKPKRWHPLLPAPEQVTVLRTDTTIGQIGKVKGLAQKVWKLTEQDPVLSEIIEIPGSGVALGALVVIRLKSKTIPTKVEFETNKEQIITELTEVKRDDAVKRWVFQRCEALRAAGQIKFEQHVADIVFYTGKGDRRKKSIYKYVPCQRLHPFGRASPGFQMR